MQEYIGLHQDHEDEDPRDELICSSPMFHLILLTLYVSDYICVSEKFILAICIVPRSSQNKPKTSLEHS